MLTSSFPVKGPNYAYAWEVPGTGSPVCLTVHPFVSLSLFLTLCLLPSYLSISVFSIFLSSVGGPPPVLLLPILFSPVFNHSQCLLLLRPMFPLPQAAHLPDWVPDDM